METPKLNLLSRAMQTYSWRMKALSANLANLDTPGYQRVSVRFEEALQEARHSVSGPERQHEVAPQMEIEDRPAQLEDELMELADTQMRNQLSARALSEHFNLMRTAISGRAMG